MGGWRGGAAGARSASAELSCREDWSGWKHSDCWLLTATSHSCACSMARRCRAGLRASSLLINDWRLSQPPSLSFLFYIFLPPSPPCTSFTSQSPSTPYPSSQNIKLLFLLQSPFSCLSVCHCSLLIFPRIRHWFLLPVSLSPPARPITYNLCPTHSSTSRISFSLSSTFLSIFFLFHLLLSLLPLYFLFLAFYSNFYDCFYHFTGTHLLCPFYT